MQKMQVQKQVEVIPIVEGSVPERTSGAMIRSVQKAVQVDMAKRVAQNPQALSRKDEGTKVQNYEMLKQSLEGEIDANNKDLDEQTNMKSETEEQKSTDEGVRTFKLQRLSAARASVLSSYKKRRKACEPFSQAQRDLAPTSAPIIEDALRIQLHCHGD